MLHLFLFFLNPYREEFATDNRKDWKLLVKCLVILILLLSVTAALKVVTLNIFFTNIEIQGNYNGATDSYFYNVGKPVFLLDMMLLAPIVEELAFRYGFSFKKNAISVGLVFLLTMVVGIITKSAYSTIACFVIASILSYYLYMSKEQTYFDKIKTNYGRYIVHVVTALFALLHIFNYSYFDKKIILDCFFSMVSIALTSYVILYVRLKFNFIYGVAIHIAINTFSIRGYF